jgi:Bacterial regulatory protein, Fis family
MLWQPGMTIANMEKEVIREAMQFFNRKKDSVASALGISLRTLYNKLALYNLANDVELANPPADPAASISEMPQLKQKGKHR